MSKRNLTSGIQIVRFKGFEDSIIDGFGRVNLITGLNNVGKTVLLEALYIGHLPNTDTIMDLLRSRRFDNKSAEQTPENTWNNLYFNGNTENSIRIKTSFHGTEISREVEFKNDTSVEPFRKYLDESENEDEGENNGVDARNLLNSLSRPSFRRSVLHIDARTLNGDDGQIESSHLMSTSEGIMGKRSPFMDKTNVVYFPSSLNIKSNVLAGDFDKVAFNGQKNDVLEVLQLVDDTIEDIETFSFGTPRVHLKQKQRPKPLPIYEFGDAISRVFNIAVGLFNNESSIVLIDELENGIHYTKQYAIWKKLFELAEELDIQMFATTHSEEMLQAFQKVRTEMANKVPSVSASYIELARSPRTGKINGITRSIDSLDYALEHNKGVRGE